MSQKNDEILCLRCSFFHWSGFLGECMQNADVPSENVYLWRRSGMIKVLEYSAEPPKEPRDCNHFRGPEKAIKRVVEGKGLYQLIRKDVLKESQQKKE